VVGGDDIGVMPPHPDDRGVAGLFTALAREASRLFRQEIALAKAELTQKVGRAGTGAVEVAAGGLILYAGFLALLAAAALALTRVLPDWAAALVVGVVVILIGAVLVLKGKRDLGPRRLLPDHTLRTLREDARWAREQVR
jgi:Putative Actinobacterial Holin-X, holin superfamily III